MKEKKEILRWTASNVLSAVNLLGLAHAVYNIIQITIKIQTPEKTIYIWNKKKSSK